ERRARVGAREVADDAVRAARLTDEARIERDEAVRLVDDVDDVDAVGRARPRARAARALGALPALLDDGAERAVGVARHDRVAHARVHARRALDAAAARRVAGE